MEFFRFMVLQTSQLCLTSTILLCILISFPYGQGLRGQVADNWESDITAAQRALDLGQFQQSLLLSNRLHLRVAPPNSSATNKELFENYLINGRARLALTKIDSAIYFLEQAQTIAIKLDKQAANTVATYLGTALAAKREFAEAENLLNAAENYFSTKKKLAPFLAETKLAQGVCWLRQGKFDQAYEAFQQTIEILSQAPTSLARTRAQAHLYSGFVRWRQKNYTEGIDRFKQAEDIFLNSGGPDNDYLAGLYTNMGACYDDMGFIYQAVQCYEKAYPIFSRQSLTHPYLVSVYNNMGNSYGDLGEHTYSIRYLEQAVALRPENPRYRNNLGDAYMRASKYAQAETAFEKALQLFGDQSAPDSVEVARPLHNLGIIYRKRKEHLKALKNEVKSVAYRKAGGMKTLGIARSYLGVAQTLLALNKLEEAKPYLDSTLTVYTSVLPGGRHPEIATSRIALAEYHLGVGEWQKAIDAVDGALEATGYAKDDLSAVNAPLELLAALRKKGSLYKWSYQQHNRVGDLKDAFNIYLELVTAIQDLRGRVIDGDSKTIVANQYFSALAEGIEVAYKLSIRYPDDPTYKETAFQFSEQSKALTLIENIRAAAAIQLPTLPDSLQEQERRLRLRIVELENLKAEYLRETDFEKIEARQSSLDLELFNARLSHERLLKSLSVDHPEYSLQKQTYTFADVQMVRETLLKPRSTLIEYFYSDEHLYIFAISAKTFSFKQIALTQPLEKTIIDFREGISDYFLQTRSINRDALLRSSTVKYIQAAAYLYQLLIEPVEEQLTTSLVIIPDGLLGHLSFDALLTSGDGFDQRNFASYPYMFRNKDISYCYSATLLREMTTISYINDQRKTILAMAPFYEKSSAVLRKAEMPDGFAFDANSIVMRDEFGALPESGIEVALAGKLWEGEFKVGEAASKESFLAEANEYKIIHLATHAVADFAEGKLSYIAFGNQPKDLLQVRELYNLNLKADLVVLSACESGVGQLQRGEGTISVGRAFADAGAKSIVTTLWLANESSTKKVMLDFHKHLHRGVSISRALQLARIDYVDGFRAGSSLDKHPFFWASFAIVGDATTRF